MGEFETMTIARLQERAEQCRRLARQAISMEVAVELENLAREYDRDLVRLEVTGSSDAAVPQRCGYAPGARRHG